MRFTRHAQRRKASNERKAMFEIIGQITVGVAVFAGIYFAYKKGLFAKIAVYINKKEVPK